MTQHCSDKEAQVLQKTIQNARNNQRLSTLKLWQLHLQSLSKPEKQPLLKRYHDDYEITETHTVSASTIVSSDDSQTRVKYIEDDDCLTTFDVLELADE